MPCEEVEKLERRGVHPVEVFHHEKQWALPRDSAEQAYEAPEEVRLGMDRLWLSAASDIPQEGENRSELRQVHPRVGCNLRGIQVVHQGEKSVRQGSVWNPRFQGISASGGHVPSAPFRIFRNAPYEPGFPHSRLTRQEDRSPSADFHLRQCG